MGKGEMSKAEATQKGDAIKFTLMALVLFCLSIFFVDKSLPIACLLFFEASLIAIVDYYTVTYLTHI